jgi:hypothetical protein
MRKYRTVVEEMRGDGFIYNTHVLAWVIFWEAAGKDSN